MKKEYIVSGYSMYPSLLPGQRLSVRDGDLKVGTIVCLKPFSDRKPLIHRVIFLGKSFLLTAGDNRFFPDTPIKYEDVSGIIDVTGAEKIRLSLSGYIKKGFHYIIMPFWLVFFYFLRLLKKYVVNRRH